MTQPIPSLRRAVAAGALGWFLMLVWSGVFWGALYQPVGVFADATPAVAEAAALLQREGVPAGTHFFPWPRDTPEARARWLAAHRSGPVMELHWVPQGADSEAPSKFLAGMAQYALVVALFTWMLRRVRVAGGTRRDGVAILAAAATAAVVFVDLTPPILFDLPWHHFLTLAGHDAVALALPIVAGSAVHR